MSAYVVVHVQTENPSKLARYKELAAPSMKKHGVRLIGTSGPSATLEGASDANMTVLLEAQSDSVIRAWYSSEEYSRAIDARKGLAEFTMVIVHGTE